MENPFYHMAAIFLPTWSLTGESSLTIGRLLLPLLNESAGRVTVLGELTQEMAIGLMIRM